MAQRYKYHSRRSAKRLARKSKRNFILTLIIIIFLIYATIVWILPFLINTIGFINNKIKPTTRFPQKALENASLAPPVLNIPYEATNSSQITISGFASSNTKVRLYIDDQLTEEVVSATDGSFIIEKVSLNLGTNNIYGKTVDNEGKMSLPSKLIKLIFDNEKPILEVSEPEDGKKVSGDKKVKISGKTEVGAQVFINNSRVIVDRDGNFSTDQSLNDGDNDFNIKALDQALNSVEIVRRVTYQP